MTETPRPPVKVVEILYSGLGGHGSVAFSLAHVAAAAGRWRPAMLFMGIEPTLPAYHSACAAAGYPEARVLTRPGRQWASWPALFRALHTMRPDAIVLHSVKAIIPAALYAWWRSIPLIAVEHQPNALKSRAEWWASSWLQRFAGAIVVLTEDYRSMLRARLGRHWREDKVHLVPNGIDTALFSPLPPAGSTAASRAASGGRVIGMAARMTTMKRQDLLIDALAALRADGDDWRLSLAGDGETVADLRARASALGLGDAVEFTGYLGVSELVGWFRRIDLYAHASNGETLSTSLLQALAMGLPIVGSDVPGIGDLLAKGGGVGIAVAQSPDAFASAMRKVAAHPDLEHDLRVRARKLAEAKFSQQAMFEHYDRVLDSLCSR
jgi:glycosyltransferase involved in cell wall biosynthesis